MSGRSSVLRIFAAIAIAASLAAAAGSAWRAREAADRATALAGELESLRGELTEQAAQRDALEAEIAQLRAALAATPPSAPPDAPLGSIAADERDAVPDEVVTPDLHAGARPIVAAKGFDVDELVAAGFRRDDVERLRARVDEIDLARLELHDRAMREGWAATPRFTQENRALNQAFAGLRGEFGDDLYDWLLYSTGQPNRVAIGEVIAGGAGEAAGLASGDVILRYDDRLVLDALELRNATFAGRAGELVAIEVLREGEPAPLRYFVPRGPIGVRLAPTVGAPVGSG